LSPKHGTGWIKMQAKVETFMFWEAMTINQNNIDGKLRAD
jgi:hypothetical protein